MVTRGRTPLRTDRLRNQAGLALALVVYLFLLLVFAGVIPLPTTSGQAQGSGTTGPSPPPAIFTQTPPVAFVHSASLTYGFLFSVALVFLVNRRYRVFVSDPSSRASVLLDGNQRRKTVQKDR